MILIEKYHQNKSFRYFAIYSITCISFGCAISGLGPAIPFLAKQSQIQQTQYSFLFMARAIGFIAMTLLVKFIQKYFNMHTLMITGVIAFAACYIGFTFTRNFFLQGTFVFAGAAAVSLMMIISNQAMLVSHTGSDQQFWVQLNHGTFGIGGLIGPFIIRFLHIYGFLVISLIGLAVCPFYFKYQSPQILKKNQKANQNQENTGQPIENYFEPPQNVFKFMYLTSILIIGVEVSFPGWSPSYAVLQGVQTQSGATKFSSLFWMSMTLSRFIFAFFDATVVEKLAFSVKCSVASSLICSLLAYVGMNELALYVSAFSLGLFFAPYFPLTLSLPSQLKHKLPEDQITNLFIFACVGEGLISFIHGLLMEYVSLNMFFHLTTVICLILYYSMRNTIFIFQQSLKTNQVQNSKELNSIMLFEKQPK